MRGYERTYAIWLFNDDPKGTARILRPRQPISSSVMQEALFLAARISRGQLLVQPRGILRCYPVSAVTIERPGLCLTGACDLEE